MKAVIPAAGLGTHLPPAAKSMPKEMLPVVDKSVTQYVVEETVQTGCNEIQLTDAIAEMARQDGMCASLFEGPRLDVGSVEGSLAPNSLLGLRIRKLDPETINKQIPAGPDTWIETVSSQP